MLIQHQKLSLNFKKTLCLSIVYFLLSGQLLLANDIPLNDGFVTDNVGILSEEQEKSLENFLSDYQEKTSNEIAILIQDSLSEFVPIEYAVDVHRNWGLGSKEKNNGALLIYAYDDRLVVFHTGYGLEGVLPDIVTKGITTKDIVPFFKKGEYYNGFVNGIDSIKKHIGNEYTAERYQESSDFNFPLELLFIGWFLVNFLGAFLARTKEWWLGGIIGALVGFVFLFLLKSILYIPVLGIIGLVLDYILSKKRVETSSSRNKAHNAFRSFSRYKPMSGGFRGFGGGSGGGGGSVTRF